MDILKNYAQYPLWKKYLSPGHSSLEDELPWLTFTAIDFIKKNNSTTDVVFEYGGGGSTLFFLKYAGRLITIEHDRPWFEKLQEIIAGKKNEKWEGHLIPAEKNDGEKYKKEISNPDDYASDDANFIYANFRQYTSAIDRFPDNYFDRILIDGRARTSCLKHSFQKLKPGGFLILDNAERKYYTEAHKETLKTRFTLIVSRYGPVPFSEDFSQTNIWKKNK
jgi:SAM-dependent methyltransferase